ncbi:DUF397 domain-containing protein [Streptomyces sp. NPDC008139]|uniref:DUF397 domain-containing protein n=1 Tax=Streptomyces sp. NPDC008139 TaxID=3364814 RepID=UPI0036E0B2CF
MSGLGTYRGARYVTSTHSNPGDCVAVARPAGHGVAVKDSKDPHGPVLEFTRDAWADFLTDLPQAVSGLSG